MKREWPVGQPYIVRIAPVKRWNWIRTGLSTNSPQLSLILTTIVQVICYICYCYWPIMKIKDSQKEFPPSESSNQLYTVWLIKLPNHCAEMKNHHQYIPQAKICTAGVAYTRRTEASDPRLCVLREFLALGLRDSGKGSTEFCAKSPFLLITPANIEVVVDTAVYLRCLHLAAGVRYQVSKTNKTTVCPGSRA